MLLNGGVAFVNAYVPPDQHRHEQLTAMRAAFSRYESNGINAGKAVPKPELTSFLRYVVESMNSPSVQWEQVQIPGTSADFTAKLLERLPAEASAYTLDELLKATEALIEYPAPSAEEPGPSEPGSKQLRTLRANLRRNRETMPLFDTPGWVRDFEKALKLQWEIYANGLLPMHIVVGRSDHLYGTYPLFVG